MESRPQSHGIHLLNLIAVVVIIGVLVVEALPPFMGVRDLAHEVVSDFAAKFYYDDLPQRLEVPEEIASLELKDIIGQAFCTRPGACFEQLQAPALLDQLWMRGGIGPFGLKTYTLVAEKKWTVRRYSDY